MRPPRRIRCLSCQAALDDVRSFCDDQCEQFAREHGYSPYLVPKRDRGFPESRHVRKSYR